MSRQILLLLLSPIAVQAFFRPIYSGGGGGHDCEETATSSPSESTPSESTPSQVTPKYSYTCPEEEAKKHIITDLKHATGSVAIAGDRLKQCVTGNNPALLDENMKTPPCNDKKLEYTLPASANTNAEFLWNSWALNEPSHNMWQYESEDCLQMVIKPTDPNRNGKINDIYCLLNAAPNNPTDTSFMNYGAYCGKPVDIEATI
ncbi:Protein CBR-CLEC-147 [Caenorhabditis briggsae]|uniref:Protein CBR-CLEC-147 n=1 Tax=Caenorhabditis briggsae TaxID=6238 RepID=A8XYU6_CAEBR|nr:Protein CBR-CLEC-147 [Caenorhabditis briggsae]CAP37813.2 Protein CBR-CLEC-147 [Caenorhabditis briggsae]